MSHDEGGTSILGGRAEGLDAPRAPLSRVGRYRLASPLGSGSFGDVFLAVEDGPLARRGALKFVRPNARGAALDAALREARLLARLEHRSIARLIDAGTPACCGPSGSP